MKKFYLILFFIFSISSFGQQFLWSTLNDTSSKYIPIENVTEEVIKFYDHYDFYHDGSGYNKENFFKMFERLGANSNNWEGFKESVKNIEQLTVFALRDNTGQGSVVIVIFITKQNINVVAFSNSYKEDSILTYDKKRFESWIETLKD